MKAQLMKYPFIMVAPNGARRTKADHPAIPVSIQDTVDTAIACHAAGADALHLHIRDKAGQHSLDAAQYHEALAELAVVLPDLPVQITTEAAGLFDTAAQLACLAQVKPQWASVSVREIARAPELADSVYGTCAANGTKVQHILYTPDDFAILEDWQARGVIRPNQTDMIFVLGRYTDGQVSAPRDLDPFLEAAHTPANWMVCAFGQNEHACLRAAAQNGGTLRVGFENNMHDAHGVPFSDNAASVAALRRLLSQV